MRTKGRVLAVGVVCAWLVGGLATPAHAESLNVAADAQTNSRIAALRGGSDPFMTVCNAPVCNLQPGAVFTSFARFDLSSLSDTATVDKAVLRLWAGAVLKPGTVGVVRVTDQWAECTITAASSPPLDSVALTSFPVGPSDSLHFINVDVTSLVQEWLQDPLNNHGLALVPSDGVSVLFDTKENPLTGHTPELEVTVASVGPEGPAGPKGETGDVGPQGLPGLPGLPGRPGADGAKGDPGVPGLVARGAWVASVEDYKQNDVVTDTGSTWRCIVTACTLGNKPTTPNAEWERLAAKGEQGPQGTQGPQGEQGPPGHQGEPGPKGDTGAIGPQGPAGPPLSGLETLAGIPCRQGQTGQGTVSVSYGDQGVVTLRCVPSASQLLVNPGLESSFVGWTTLGTAQILEDHPERRWHPFSGQYMAWLNGLGADNSADIHQDFVMPPYEGTGTLDFSMMIVNLEGGDANDTLRVTLVDQSSNQTIDAAFVSGAASQAWSSYSLDLHVTSSDNAPWPSVKPGSSMRLRFHGEETGGSATLFLIDQCSFVFSSKP